MDAALLFHLQQQTRKVTSDINHARMRLNNCKTMRDVKQVLQINIKPELRCMTDIVHEKHRLQQVASKKMDSILDEHLKSIGDCSSADEMRAMRINFLGTDWQNLRGGFPIVLRRAESASQRLVFNQSRVEGVGIAAAENVLQEPDLVPSSEPEQDIESTSPAPGSSGC